MDSWHELFIIIYLFIYLIMTLKDVIRLENLQHLSLIIIGPNLFLLTV